MAGVKLPKVKTPAQMKAEMAVSRARTVLPKAEREANQAKFLEEAAIKDRLYHGTTSDITEFDESKARSKTGNINAVLGTFMSDNPAEANRFATEWGTTGGNVMPVYTSLKNPYHATYKEMDDLAMGVYRRMMKDPSYDPNRTVRGFDKEGHQRTYDMIAKHESGALQDAFDFKKQLMDAGHDGIVWNLNGNKEVIAFDPKQIKSAIGNQGTYDTTNPDITKAHGGIVKMSKGGLKPVKAPKVSAPKVESPTVMNRSDVSDLFRLISEREGSYGARRVERAADEIPNLEKLYTLDALRSAFSGDNARALMTMKPADFEKYAAPLLTNLSQQSNDNIANLKSIQNVGGFADVPFLLVNKELAGSTGLPWVTGHEGRHRNRAMDEAGVQSGLVQFLPRAELREPFPRRSQEQYIDAIRKEMALSGNKIKPEKIYLNETDEKTYQRPAIDLPDLYANGGAVKMAEGGTPDREFIDRMREEFSVYNKPTYGNEIPGTPTIDQQRYELSRQGQREAEGRSRMNLKDIAALAYPSAGIDALKTIGKSIVALPAYGAVDAFDWLQTGKMDPARSKQRGRQIDEWIAPKTQEGGELLEEIAKVGPAITGSEMGFGMHPNLWVSGIGMTTPKQTAAGLRLGSERVAPFAKDVGSMASELYMSGKMPGMVAPNMYAVSPDGKPSKVLAPANESGFYSPTEAAALNLQRKSGAGQAFLNDIMKGENVRSDEIKTMGLDTFLKDKKNVTADEVRDYIAQNKIQLGETTYAKKPSVYDFAINQGMTEDYAAGVSSKADQGDPKAVAVMDAYRNLQEPKFSDYALPGGENYREIVLTLPQSPEHVEFSRLNKKMNDDDGLLPDDMQRWTELGSKLGEEGRRQAREGRYQSSHWGEESNPLAHLRVSDRVTDGKKTLLVDEVQSDWHQAGREQGYKNDIDMPSMSADELLMDYGDKLSSGQKDYLKDFTARWDRAEQEGNTDRLDNLSIEYQSWANRQKIAGVPDAPYKDDWYQLTLRRAIKEAIDGGYDRVALPTGTRVAERFDLSKQIDRIDYNKNDDGTYSMSAIKDGREVFAKEGLDEKELSGIVGKDVAKKIVGDEGGSAPKADRWESEDGDEPEFKSLSGLDLSVGGEGMKKYYDEIYPGYLKKFGKKYGANVGTTYAKTDINEWPFPIQIESDGKNFWLYGQDPRIDKKAKLSNNFNSYEDANKFRDSMYEGNTEPLHYMEITPAMRKEFSTGIPMKRGGKVQFANNIDAMRLALSKG